MAPRKGKVDEEKANNEAVVEATLARAVTRSMTKNEGNSTDSKRVGSSSPKVLNKRSKKQKVVKAEGKKQEETKEEVEEEKVEERENNGEEKTTVDAVNHHNKKTIVVEHCKQCNSFKQRAILVKVGLEKSVPGVNVLLNPDKPRRGCFEIREEAGETFISLLDMKRPFKPMKELDMEKVVSDIIQKLK